MKRFQCCLLVAALSVFGVLSQQRAAWAQTVVSAKQQEEAGIRAELQRIIQQDPVHAAKAQEALTALNKPEASAEGRQARNRRERGGRRIVNGLISRSHPAVGALVRGSAPQTAGAWCTGTLVGCDKFLTAAHCIAGDPAPGSYLVFFQELGFFRVKAIRWDQDKYAPPTADLAMLTLEKPVEGIAPMAINASVTPLNGSIATIVGFGRTGGSRKDYGIKREGSIKTVPCTGRFAAAPAICWNFDADVTSDASAQNTCNADSGGGVFMRDNEGSRIVEKVFGVVSGGTDRNCVNNDLSYNVDVFKYRDWIEQAGEGRLSSSACGRPLWEGDTRAPRRETVHLDANAAEAGVTIEVPEGIAALRIAMNAEDDGAGKNQFQFTAFSSKNPASSVNACQENGTGQFAFCAIENPQSGPWTITLSRKKGEGDVQITTLFVAPDR